MECFKEPEIGIATLIQPLKTKEDLTNPNVVKVVVDNTYRALYFSRSPIPYLRDPDNKQIAGEIPFYHHIGLLCVPF